MDKFEQDLLTKYRKGVMSEEDSEVWSRIYENPRVIELEGKSETGKVTAILCAVMLAIGIIQLWVDFTFLILLFAPIGVFVGIAEYSSNNKRRAFEIEMRWKIEKAKKKGKK